jgi:hypothetical protein
MGEVREMVTKFIETKGMFGVNTIREAPWHVKAVVSLAIVGLLVIIGAAI